MINIDEIMAKVTSPEADVTLKGLEVLQLCDLVLSLTKTVYNQAGQIAQMEALLDDDRK